jgi:hypothetical protein
MTGLRLDDPHDRMRLDLAAMLVVLRGWPPDLHVDRLGSKFRESPEVRFQVMSMSDHNPEDPAAAGSDELAGVLAGVDGEVGAERHHLVA